MTSPIASVRSLRTHGAVGAGAGPASAGGHAHPVSPKQPVSPLQINSVKPFQRPPYTNQDALRHSPKPVNVSAALPEMTAFEDSIPEKGAPDSPILPTKMPMPSMNSPLYPPLQQHHIGFPPPHSYLNPGPAPYKIYQPHNMDNNVIVRQVQLESAVPGMPYGTLIHPPREYLPVIPAVQPKGCNNVYDTPKNSNSNSNGNSNNWIPRDGKTKIKDFFMACRNGSIEAVKWHLNHGANVMEPYDNMSGRTPLHAAAMSDSYEVMRLLCEAAGPRLNLNELDDSSQTPLHLLTLFGRNSHESLVYMLKKGANPNAQDSERRTPLMTSFILNDNALVVETLLDYGADPNIRCQENNALAEAAIRLRFQCVKVLLETDLSMSEQSSLEHAMDVCYRVTESVNRNQVLSLLVRWKNSEGMQKRQTLARMILKGTLPFGEKRIDQQRIARQVLAFANHQ
ncbi:ankyrin repeat-containing domain protein [Gamsiella multidivaricata]|uniref:ankyrin repeat-containing domain protein n=1 Tax=Gamsiella multidivaricata TaxID=101098 RepID=UPI00221EB2D0|nr:ankyrin repeat-containing domain protein [Gamsiella multidivaricata]KAG0369600.1 hypothetical protein BGZ54_009478 [Gamsiella multidivaricata]KAI7816940.1 ankyrin repeat-containing domain protein [Gamsiella multidivaricata]